MAKGNSRGSTKTLSISPLGDRVVVKKIENTEGEKKSASGIIIPVTAQEEKTDRGLVVAVGEGRIDSDGKRVPMQVKIGDKVIFQWGDKLIHNDEEYFVVSETSILAVIK